MLSYVLAGVGCVIRRTLLRRIRFNDSDCRFSLYYGYATLGELVAWIIGWDLILEYAFGAATVAAGGVARWWRFCRTMDIRLAATNLRCARSEVGLV